MLSALRCVERYRGLIYRDIAFIRDKFLGLRAGAIIQDGFDDAGGLSPGEEQERPDDGVSAVFSVLSVGSYSPDSDGFNVVIKVTEGKSRWNRDHP